MIAEIGWASIHFCKLVYGDKQVGVTSGRPLERSNQIEPLDHERPRDGDHLECLGRQVGLLSIVLKPFPGVYDMLSIGHHDWLVEALSECISDQGSRHGMVTADPAMDIAQQLLPLLDGDAVL